MFRDAFEDYKRHQNDKESNNTLILALRPVGKESSFTPIKAEQIKVGDIILIKEGETFCADMILLCSANFDG